MFNMFPVLQEGEPGGGSGGTAPAAVVVPESYAFAPVDGTPIDATIVTEVSEFAKANKLSQEQAQSYMTRELGLRAKAAPGTPEAYTYAKIKAKNEAGAEVEQDVDAELVAEISAFAKANGLSQKQAQAYMDRELKLAGEANAEQAGAVKALQDKWLGEAKQLPELAGPDGQQFDANIAVSKRALTKFFPEIAGDANSHPFLDHPQVLKGLLSIGKLLSADGEFVGGHGNSTPVDPAKVMFPNMS